MARGRDGSGQIAHKSGRLFVHFCYVSGASILDVHITLQSNYVTISYPHKIGQPRYFSLYLGSSSLHGGNIWKSLAERLTSFSICSAVSIDTCLAFLREEAREPTQPTMATTVTVICLTDCATRCPLKTTSGPIRRDQDLWPSPKPRIDGSLQFHIEEVLEDAPLKEALCGYYLNPK